MKTISGMMAGRARSLRHISRTFPQYQEGMSAAEYILRFAELNKSGISFDKQGAEVLPYDLSEYMHPCAVPQGPEVIAEVLQ